MKTIRYGDDEWLIRDDDVATPLVDWITEARHTDGIIYLGLGTSLIDASNQPEIRIRVRPRMTVRVAKQLHEALGKLIAEASQPSP